MGLRAGSRAKLCLGGVAGPGQENLSAGHKPKVAQRSEEVTWRVLRGDAAERLLSHHRALGNCVELEGGL